MTVRPIIFSGAMVLALMAGTKTQTRRLVTSPLAECQPGDLLYVRETQAYVGNLDPGISVYRADYPDCPSLAGVENIPPAAEVRWRPSIHMPRKASRLTLEVTEVRRQRLKDLTEADAIAEGILTWSEAGGGVADPLYLEIQYGSCATAFTALWDDLHGAEASCANPEVVAISFIVHRQNVDALVAERAAS